MALSSEAKQEVERFLLEGKKIAAVKYLADTYSFSLRESKMLVDALEQNFQGAVLPPDFAGVDVGEHVRYKDQLVEMLKSGGKMEAIKHATHRLNMPLKKAKDLVDEVERELYPRNVRRRANAPAIILYIFVLAGVALMGGAAFVYFRQSGSISKSDRIQGKVIRLQSKSDHRASPVIEYEWDGKKWLYASNVYSSPPSYAVNEVVPMYVNRTDPTDVIIDTFLYRYFLMTVLGGMGCFFVAISCGVSFVLNKR